MNIKRRRRRRRRRKRIHRHNNGGVEVDRHLLCLVNQIKYYFFHSNNYFNNLFDEFVWTDWNGKIDISLGLEEGLTCVKFRQLAVYLAVQRRGENSTAKAAPAPPPAATTTITKITTLNTRCQISALLMIPDRQAVRQKLVASSLSL